MRFKYGIYSTDSKGKAILQEKVRCEPDQVRKEVERVRKRYPYLLGLHTRRIGN